jgi:L-ascorbate metabolism protein UlaG (beta-lactamase superfamily)
MPNRKFNTSRLLAPAVGLAALAFAPPLMGAYSATGARAKDVRMATMKASPNWKEGKFVNTLPQSDIRLGPILLDWFNRPGQTEPKGALPVLMRTAQDFEAPPPSGLRITWLGHSTALIEIDGHRVLLDPVWGDRASPFESTGPKRFHATPLALDQLPEIDIVAISHDHYDHLDHETIIALGDKVPLYAVPLGVGAHLEDWGIPPERIVELDWWGEVAIGDLKLIATPARHASGRSLTLSDRDETLWSGWAIHGPEHRVYYSGDTAMFPELADIGQRLGPFDASLIETGAYNPLWADVHMGPEQAIVAHELVRGGLFIPVHWGTFDLAVHNWTEPVERTLAAAELAGIAVTVPRPGESIEPSAAPALQRWWPQVPWQTAIEVPVVSTGLSDSLEQRIRALSTRAPQKKDLRSQR